MIKSPFFRYGSVVLLVFCLIQLLWWLFPGLCSISDLQVEDQVMRLAYERQKLRPVNPDIVHIDLDDQSISSLIYDKNDPRLYTELIKILKKSISLGYLDTTFYRDDFRRRDTPKKANATNISFIIENKKVILIDDVLYTGRSIRASLDAPF